MRDENEKKKASANWAFVIFGVAVMAGGIFWLTSLESFKRTAIETQGTIIRMEWYKDSDGDSQRNAIVEFTAGGATYTGGIGYTSGLKKGKTVTIFYNPANPQDFKESSDSLWAIVLLAIGFLCLLAGFTSPLLKLVLVIKARKANAFPENNDNAQLL